MLEGLIEGVMVSTISFSELLTIGKPLLPHLRSEVALDQLFGDNAVIQAGANIPAPSTNNDMDRHCGG